MSEAAIEPAPADDLEADIDMAIVICGGDVRAALRATLVANAFLEAELERMKEMLSAGYGRGRVRPVPKRKAAKST